VHELDACHSIFARPHKEPRDSSFRRSFKITPALLIMVAVCEWIVNCGVILIADIALTVDERLLCFVEKISQLLLGPTWEFILVLVEIRLQEFVDDNVVLVP
jgi:hypothetical protein